MGWRRGLILLGKMAAALVGVALGLEVGTRIFAPMESFDYIPNRYDPVAGIVQIPGARGFIKNREYEIDLRINSHGLRDREFDHRKSPSTRRILCLGDSFTNGFGVDADETFAKEIERGLAGADPPPRWEVLNGGVAATGTAHQLAWLQSQGLSYDPDLVLVTVSPNDFVDNVISGLWSLGPEGALIKHQAPRSRTLKLLRLTRHLPGYATWFSRSHFLNAVKQRFARFHHARLERESSRGADDDAGRDRENVLAAALVEELAATCARHDAQLVMMIVPTLPDAGPVEQQVARLIRHIESADIPCIDLAPRFTALHAQGIETNYPRDGHWNREGHRAAAGGFLESSAWSASGGSGNLR